MDEDGTRHHARPLSGAASLAKADADFYAHDWLPGIWVGLLASAASFISAAWFNPATQRQIIPGCRFICTSRPPLSIQQYSHRQKDTFACFFLWAFARSGCAALWSGEGQVRNSGDPLIGWPDKSSTCWADSNDKKLANIQKSNHVLYGFVISE